MIAPIMILSGKRESPVSVLAVASSVTKRLARILVIILVNLYFLSSFGHGVGVEIHEGPNATPSNDKPLPAGAVISAEPGIYLPGKLGVRIEDVLYLTPEGCQNLTLAPKELVIL